MEERIGNVNTGLSEEAILKSMKQKKHIAFMPISNQNLEPCCICQVKFISDFSKNIYFDCYSIFFKFICRHFLLK